MIIRQPGFHEIDAVLALFADEVRAGKMLPRTPEMVRDQIHHWLVAESDGQIVGCVSLVQFNPELCEIRSLAVHPDYRGQHIASELIESALALARTYGMQRVLTLTRAARLFEQLGFQRNYVGNFPEKVWRDCAPCPFQHACDEVALIFDLCHEGVVLHEGV